jgi:superoxide dismutase, Fe-Mn family
VDRGEGMSNSEEYLNSVLNWSKQLREYFDQEQVDKENELWLRLNAFDEHVNVLRLPLSPEELINLQSQVNELHSDIDQFQDERQQEEESLLREPAVPIGGHTLPPLNYRYDALEPYISEEIMRLHHDVHHRSYVEGLNKAEKMLQKAREAGDFTLVKNWSRELAFHGSGHYLHTIFWNNMSPNGGGQPRGKLMKEIEKYFGSYASFKKHFSEAAKQVEGVGWGVLVWSPRSRHLEILQSERHQLLTQWDTIPLLVLDVWEHAYYLQYKTKRADYVENWWNIVNWRNVEERFENAEKLKWKPF